MKTLYVLPWETIISAAVDTPMSAKMGGCVTDPPTNQRSAAVESHTRLIITHCLPSLSLSPHYISTMCSRWIYLKSERERERAVECCVRASVKHAALQVSPSCRDWLASDKSAPPSVMSIRRHQQLDSCSSVLPLEMSLQFSTPYSIYRLYSRSCIE
jgi:hypothetical protein